MLWELNYLQKSVTVIIHIYTSYPISVLSHPRQSSYIPKCNIVNISIVIYFNSDLTTLSQNVHGLTTGNSTSSYILILILSFYLLYVFVSYEDPNHAKAFEPFSMVVI